MTTTPKIQMNPEGARTYILGNTFAIKDTIKAAGGHWDSERRAWWIGSQKAAALESAINQAEAPKEKVSEQEEIYSGEVRGKAEYKGKSYFIRWSGRTAAGKDAFRLVSFDGKMSFWADASEVKVTKHYQAKEPRSFYGRRSAGRAEYPTLASIRQFVEEKKQIEAGGECPTCARNFASGRWAPYFGSGDYDDCPQCGATHQELR